MSFNHFIHIIQTQTRSLNIMNISSRYTIKLIEYILLLFFIDSNPLSFIEIFNFSIKISCRYFNFGIFSVYLKALSIRFLMIFSKYTGSAKIKLFFEFSLNTSFAGLLKYSVVTFFTLFRMSSCTSNIFFLDF